MKEIVNKHFIAIEDSRCSCDVEHKLVDILIIIMCGVLCGIDSLQGISTYAENKLDFLSKHFGIKKIPSNSTFSRILKMINSEIVSIAIVNIMKEWLGVEGDIIAIDGKTIRSTKNMKSISKSLQILTAYATENGVTLGQLSINEKTNEIPVLRDLLETIDIKGKIITADAMHCQKETCAKIIESGGDYLLGVKENQKKLHDEIESYVEANIDELSKIQIAQTVEKSRERYESRTCFKIIDVNCLNSKDQWNGLGCAFAMQRITISENKTTDETNYYICSRNEEPERLMEIVRNHWKIESMHWQLDVVFSEDDCRLQSSDGQKSLNSFRKLALALHKNFLSSTKKKSSTKNNMFNCLLNDNLLIDILSHNCNNQ